MDDLLIGPHALVKNRLIFADHEGKILGETSGYYDGARFLLLLSYLDSDLFDEMTFEEYEARFEKQ